MKLSMPKQHAVQRMVEEAAALEIHLGTTILSEHTRRDRPGDDELSRALTDAKASVGVARAILIDVLKRSSGA